MPVRVIISDQASFGAHGENIKTALLAAYPELNPADVLVRYDFGFSADLNYAASIGAIAVVRSITGPSASDISLAQAKYPTIQCFFPLGSNNYVELTSPSAIPVIVTSGAGDTQNKTAYGNGLEFWDTEAIDPGFQSSYSNGTVAGKLLKIKDRRGGSWWDARNAARKTTNQYANWNKFDGYGQINITMAIVYSGVAPQDPYAPVTVESPPPPPPTNPPKVILSTKPAGVGTAFRPRYTMNVIDGGDELQLQDVKLECGDENAHLQTRQLIDAGYLPTDGVILESDDILKLL